MMKPIRKMIGSRSKYWARPPATPATLRSVRLRSRRRACGALCDVVSVMGRAWLGAGRVPIRNVPGPTLQSTRGRESDHGHGEGRAALDLAERGLDVDALNESLWRLAIEAESALGLREAVADRY